MRKTKPVILLIIAASVVFTATLVFSCEQGKVEMHSLPDHPPETVKEREAVESRALEIALSDPRVKSLMDSKKCGYDLQSNCYTLHKLLFEEEQWEGSGEYHLGWDGELRGQVVLSYDDGSIYCVHVDVTDETVRYTMYIKWGKLDPESHESATTEPDEWVNIFNDGRAQNLLDGALTEETVKHLREVWNVHGTLPFNGCVISPPEN